MLIARFEGDVAKLAAAYDRAHDVIMCRGGAVRVGELRHDCPTPNNALSIIGVWASEQAVRSPWASVEFKDLLASVGSAHPDGIHGPRSARDRASAHLSTSASEKPSVGGAAGYLKCGEVAVVMTLPSGVSTRSSRCDPSVRAQPSSWMRW